MKFYRELDDLEKDRCIVVTYYIEVNSVHGRLNDAAWDLAIGQSVGNPKQRNNWETEDIFEMSSCVIYDEEENLKSKLNGFVKIGFPKINSDWDNDGVSHLLCQIMGGQLDIDVFKVCRVVDIEFPESVKKSFLKPKYGMSGIREFTNQYNKPLLGGIVKPKTGISVKQLGYIVKELVDGGVDFIKEDEILSNPSFCRLEERVEHIANIISDSGRNVVFAHCINSDPHAILDRAKLVYENGGNGIHVNFWSGFGAYNSIRKLDLPLFMHFQKSGDKILTNSQHNFKIDWYVICKLAALMGVDTIHTGMWGGYLSDDEQELERSIRLLNDNNVVPALSCGMHPGLVEAIARRFGVDYMANVGGAIHSHPEGTLGGARAMRQALDRDYKSEYIKAIEKWGLVND